CGGTDVERDQEQEQQAIEHGRDGSVTRHSTIASLPTRQVRARLHLPGSARLPPSLFPANPATRPRHRHATTIAWRPTRVYAERRTTRPAPHPRARSRIAGPLQCRPFDRSRTRRDGYLRSPSRHATNATSAPARVRSSLPVARRARRLRPG